MSDETFDVSAVQQYRSHKLVRAAKILSASAKNPHENEGFMLELEGVDQKWFASWDWWMTKNARTGGYLVFYEDGYTSWSPAEAFEAGYDKVNG